MTDIVDDKEYKKLQQKEMDLHERDASYQEWISLAGEYNDIGAHHDASRIWNRASLMDDADYIDPSYDDEEQIYFGWGDD